MMSWSRPELVALMLIAGLVGRSPSSVTGNVKGSVTTPEQQLELKLSALRVHRQLLQAEIARLYTERFSPETPLLLEELQQRQRDVQLQIETMEGRAHEQDAQQLAISLAADFGYLQQKLDELKQQLQQLDALQQGNNISSNKNKKQIGEAQRDGTATPTATATATPVPVSSTTPSSYFWSPLLSMPETSSGISNRPATTNSPSLIKRLMAMLRPNASSTTSSAGFLRTHWPSLDSSASSSLSTKHKLQLLSAEELLPQLQLQRQFLDDAIARLERVATKQSASKAANL
ncbi:hypothetical protein ACLKA7_006316 [Drosophila subpalustris]